MIYNWEDTKRLLPVKNEHSTVDVYGWDSSDNYWVTPNFSATFGASFDQSNNHVNVYIDTSGCISEGFKFEDFNPDSNAYNGTCTSARYYYSSEIGSSVNLKYIGEVVANIR